MASVQQLLDDDINELLDGTKKRARKNENVEIVDQIEAHPLPMSIIGQIATYVNMKKDVFGDAGDRVEKSCPHLIICGDQSSGKSTLNNKLYEYMTGTKVNVKTGIGMATLCPFEFHFEHNMTDQPYYAVPYNNLPPEYFPTQEEMIKNANEQIKIETLQTLNKIVSHIKISSEHDEFTLVDMPGLFKNLCTFQDEMMDKEKSDQLSAHFQTLLSGYISKPNAIMLHVVNFKDDIAQSTSINLIRENIQNIVARHIIIATKIDKSSKEIVISNTNSLKQLFNQQNIEIFYCIASSSEEEEMECLKKTLNNLYPVKNLGTRALLNAIPEMVSTYMKSKINELIPALKEIKQACLNNLSHIGTEPKNPVIIAHEWSEEYRKSLAHVFTTERREINQLIDENTQKNSPSYIQLLHDVGIVDEMYLKQKLQESIFARGNSFRDTTQIDGPTKEIIIEKGQLIFQTFNMFHQVLHNTITQIIDKLLQKLLISFPQCAKMNEKISYILINKISHILEEYKISIDKFIKNSCENPSDRHSGSYLRSVTETMLDKYLEIRRDNSQDGTLNINNYRQWMKGSPEFDDINIKANIIKPFIKTYMTEITNTYFDQVDIQTKTLAERLKNELYGEHVYNLVSHASSLVVETTETVNNRNYYKKLLSLIDNLFNNIQ